MPTLLLVENNLHIQRIFQDKLQREGFQVTTANDGVVGLERATEIHPDAILLDIMLPRLDGFQVLTKLREDPSLTDIPVFVLSNRSSNNDVQHASALGARHFFAKGTSRLQDIALRLREACGLKKILLFTSSVQTAAPIVAALDHPQVLCSVVTVLSETVDTAERGTPDLIIIDGRAPNALSLLQQLKTSPHAKTVPLIAIRDRSQTQRRLDEFIDGDHVDTDLRPLALKLLGLAEATVTTPAPTEAAAAAV